jgi:hypothetical protein
MKVSDAFPSKWLSAADLGGRNLRVSIDRIEMETVAPGEPQKMVVYFRGGKKGLVLNKTNAQTIAHEYGDDTDDWTGCEVILFDVMTEYQGKQVQAIRVRRPAAKDNVPARNGPPQRQPEPPTPMDDDAIPF